MRTEHHRTPLQMYVQRSLELSLVNMLPAEDVSMQLEEVEVVDDQTAIVCPLSEEQLTELRESVSPLSNEDDDLGINNYIRALDFITGSDL